MIANILIAAGFFGVGFLTGMITAAWCSLKAYKEHPKKVILLFSEYAGKF
jgi:hypothetical protein